VRCAIVIVTDNVVFVRTVGAIAQVCVSEIGDIYFRPMDPFKPRQLRFILAKSIDMVIGCFAGFDGSGKLADSFR